MAPTVASSMPGAAVASNVVAHTGQVVAGGLLTSIPKRPLLVAESMFSKSGSAILSAQDPHIPTRLLGIHSSQTISTFLQRRHDDMGAKDGGYEFVVVYFVVLLGLPLVVGVCAIVCSIRGARLRNREKRATEERLRRMSRSDQGYHSVQGDRGLFANRHMNVVLKAPHVPHNQGVNQARSEQVRSFEPVLQPSIQTEYQIAEAARQARLEFQRRIRHLIQPPNATLPRTVPGYIGFDGRMYSPPPAYTDPFSRRG